jgi:hypothetical protein
MSHDRGCWKCGREQWEYRACSESGCPKRRWWQLLPPTTSAQTTETNEPSWNSNLEQAPFDVPLLVAVDVDGLRWIDIADRSSDGDYWMLYYAGSSYSAIKATCIKKWATLPSWPHPAQHLPEMPLGRGST